MQTAPLSFIRLVRIIRMTAGTRHLPAHPKLFIGCAAAIGFGRSRRRRRKFRITTIIRQSNCAPFLFGYNHGRMFKDIIDWYLGALASGGYPLILLLMAAESSILPLPSEVVIPPAAHLAWTQGMDLFGLHLTGYP